MIAFFDVDETLITVKSMFGFLEHHLADRPGAYQRAAALLRERAAAGVPREQTNREYYANFAGARVVDVAASGKRWFDREVAHGALFHTPVVRELRALRSAGWTTVLVSGSFSACLDPIADHLGADRVLGSVPLARDGFYTGEVSATVIGEGKAGAARAVMAELGAAPADCVAFGDHASDLPMLLAVGAGVVVGDDPVLLDHAARLGWRRLPGVHANATKEVVHAAR